MKPLTNKPKNPVIARIRKQSNALGVPLLRNSVSLVIQMNPEAIGEELKQAATSGYLRQDAQLDVERQFATTDVQAISCIMHLELQQPIFQYVCKLMGSLIYQCFQSGIYIAHDLGHRFFIQQPYGIHMYGTYNPLFQVSFKADRINLHVVCIEQGCPISLSAVAFPVLIVACSFMEHPFYFRPGAGRVYVIV